MSESEKLKIIKYTLIIYYTPTLLQPKILLIYIIRYVINKRKFMNDNPLKILIKLI